MQIGWQIFVQRKTGFSTIWTQSFSVFCKNSEPQMFVFGCFGLGKLKYLANHFAVLFVNGGQSWSLIHLRKFFQNLVLSLLSFFFSYLHVRKNLEKRGQVVLFFLRLSLSVLVGTLRRGYLLWNLDGGRCRQIYVVTSAQTQSEQFGQELLHFWRWQVSVCIQLFILLCFVVLFQITCNCFGRRYFLTFFSHCVIV